MSRPTNLQATVEQRQSLLGEIAFDQMEIAKGRTCNKSSFENGRPSQRYGLLLGPNRFPWR